MRRETRALLERLGESGAFDPARPLGGLSVAQRQMVGIARALSHDCRLLIMDEPTASLSQRETRVLFELIRQLRSQGVSILYVSHRLEEVFELSDRVTVLRDGRLVATHATGAIDKRKLIGLMVGRELLATDESLSSSTFSRGARHARLLLQVRKLTRNGVFHDISFDVRAGEIVAMAGLVGAGRSEVARAIFGVDRADSGQVLIDGVPLRGNSVRDAIDRGVALVPEDRQNLGLVLQLSVGTNLALTKLNSLTRLGLISSRRERALVGELMKSLHVKAANSAVAAETL
jgi:rhamnose transport system ATP-binding protein